MNFDLENAKKWTINKHLDHKKKFAHVSDRRKKGRRRAADGEALPRPFSPPTLYGIVTREN